MDEALKAKRVTMESIEVEAASVDEAQERIESILTNEYKEGWELVNIDSEVRGIGALPVIANLLLRGARRQLPAGSGDAAQFQTRIRRGSKPSAWLKPVPTALDNGQRSPRKLLRAVIARLLGRKS